ncbi:glycosyltransferase [Parasphingorhabdus sp.]
MQFSALLCLYHGNKLSEVQEALDSAFVDQSIKPDELVTVLDGPVPADIKAYVEGFGSEALPTQIIAFPENRGHGEARAKGLEACSHDLVAMIDADDISMPLRFEKLLQEFEAYPKLAVAGGAVREFVEVDGKVEDLSIRTMPHTNEDVINYLKTRSPVAQPTSIVKRSAVLDVGNYQTWFNNEDYHLWIRLIANGYEIRNIPDVVLRFRTSPDMYSRRGGLKYWWNESRLQIYSLKQGTTSLPLLLAGSGFRFLVQVLTPNRFRSAVYKHLLRTKN